MIASYPGNAEKKEEWPGIHCLRMRENLWNRVNVSVNGLSHMPRSSTETVYGIVSE